MKRRMDVCRNQSRNNKRRVDQTMVTISMHIYEQIQINCYDKIYTFFLRFSPHKTMLAVYASENTRNGKWLNSVCIVCELVTLCQILFNVLRSSSSPLFKR